MRPTGRRNFFAPSIPKNSTLGLRKPAPCAAAELIGCAAPAGLSAGNCPLRLWRLRGVDDHEGIAIWLSSDAAEGRGPTSAVSIVHRFDETDHIGPTPAICDAVDSRLSRVSEGDTHFNAKGAKAARRSQEHTQSDIEGLVPFVRPWSSLCFHSNTFRYSAQPTPIARDRSSPVRSRVAAPPISASSRTAAPGLKRRERFPSRARRCHAPHARSRSPERWWLLRRRTIDRRRERLGAAARPGSA